MSMTPNEIRAAYLRQWRAKNRDKCKQYKKTYWEKKAAQMAAAEKEGKADALAKN